MAPDDGMTRESLSDFSTPPPTPPEIVVTKHTRRHRIRVDPKDFNAPASYAKVQPTHTAKTGATAAKPSSRRNPIVRFVYWWNGWVIRTFHTRIGTVALGTVGAET